MLCTPYSAFFLNFYSLDGFGEWRICVTYSMHNGKPTLWQASHREGPTTPFTTPKPDIWLQFIILYGRSIPFSGCSRQCSRHMWPNPPVGGCHDWNTTIWDTTLDQPESSQCSHDAAPATFSMETPMEVHLASMKKPKWWPFPSVAMSWKGFAHWVIVDHYGTPIYNRSLVCLIGPCESRRGMANGTRGTKEKCWVDNATKWVDQRCIEHMARTLLTFLYY